MVVLAARRASSLGLTAGQSLELLQPLPLVFPTPHPPPPDASSGVHIDVINQHHTATARGRRLMLIYALMRDCIQSRVEVRTTTLRRRTARGTTACRSHSAGMTPQPLYIKLQAGTTRDFQLQYPTANDLARRWAPYTVSVMPTD